MFTRGHYLLYRTTGGRRPSAIWEALSHLGARCQEAVGEARDRRRVVGGEFRNYFKSNITSMTLSLDCYLEVKFSPGTLI